MTQEQGSEVQSMYQEMLELRTRFLKYKEELTIEELKEMVSKIELFIKEHNLTNFAERIYKWHEENHPDIILTIKEFYNRLEKKDSHICIEGETGSGKSTLTLILVCCMLYLQKKEIDFDKDVLFLPRENELSRKLQSLKEYEVKWIDETIKSLNKAKWQNKDAIESNETVQTERFRHNTVFYCIPHFADLTRSFRDVNIKFRIWCVDAQRAFLRVKEIDPDIIEMFGAWHTKQRAKEKMDKKINGLSTLFERETVEKNLPGYIRCFSWEDLENNKDFFVLHLLYEVKKKLSREVVKKEDQENEVKIQTKTMDKQKSTIMGIMLKNRDKFPRFCDWFREYESCVGLNKRTLQLYWADMEAKIMK